ncbi:hypothetical protein AAEX28_04755 [Lentisphaerota bacterium WC36G]|nr:hypothetical protein LJT99_07615 [Lentisphaerae bacterium WC36]
MKKLLTILILAVATTFLFSGCQISENIKEVAKESNTLTNGTTAINKFNSVFDPVTGTFNPNALQLFVQGTYIRALRDANYVAYINHQDASVFNSDAKSSYIVLVISAKTEERFKQALDTVALKINKAANKVQNE